MIERWTGGSEQRPRALQAVKLVVTAIGVASIWTQGYLPWWFVAVSCVSVSVLAWDAIRTLTGEPRPRRWNEMRK
jgi:hypothetical protein